MLGTDKMSGKALYAKVQGNRTAFNQALEILVAEDVLRQTGKGASSKYEQDDDTKREGRVYAVVDAGNVSTESQLARYAGVHLEFIQSMVLASKIYRASIDDGEAWCRGARARAA
jgi:hypothetical protein